MTKILMGISSCERFEQNGWNDALRNTWLQNTDYKFFHGIGSTLKEDVIVVDADDSYNGITLKAKRKFQYAVDNGYDFVFHCYHDTYACVERIISLCDGHADYIGDYFHTDARQPYPHDSYGKHCQGGPGYIISRPAFTYVATELPEVLDPIDCPLEDTWTGVVIRKHENLKIEDSRLFTTSLDIDDSGPLRTNGIVTNHLSTIRPKGYAGQYTGRETEFCYSPDYMIKLHREWTTSCQ